MRTDKDDLYEDALEFVLRWEGGYVNHPLDKGGATNYGITQDTYNVFTKGAKKDVENITMFEVQNIYKTYWKSAGCDDYPAEVAFVMFDTSVNHGPERAKKMLQRLLGVKEDGIIGKITLAKLNDHVKLYGSKDTAVQLIEDREDFYKAIVKNNPSQKVFFKGWINRIDSLQEVI